MVGGHLLTQAGVLTLLMTSPPLLLLLLMPPNLLLTGASSLSSEPPRCKFPRFMQTRRNKYWMMNQSNAIATFEVDGGKIFARHGACIRSHDYSGQQRQSGVGAAECTKLNYTRVCLERRAGNKYLVRHVESDFDDKYMCLEFLRRGVSVVQVKMSLIQGEQFMAHLCDDRYMHVGPWPWISEEHYRSAPVRCPFSGGYNLRLKYASPPPARRQGYYGSQVYYGPSYYSRVSADPRSENCADSTTAPIRMESDCLKGEGIVFNFKHQSCLPADTEIALQQRALCMATWRSGRERFAMLRAHNNDRAFFCLRVSMASEPEDRNPRDGRTKRLERDSLKIDEVMVFLGWVCPTSSYADSASSSSITGNAVSPLSTPHLALSVLDQQSITEPCSDQIPLCHNLTSFCQHLQCMRTCGKCMASESMAEESANPGHFSKKATLLTSQRFPARYAKQREEGEGFDLHEDPSGRESMEGGHHEENHFGPPPPFRAQQHNFKQKCTFPQSIRGTWLRRLSDGNDEKIVISDSTFNHPRLGLLECVTFTPPGSTSAPLQRVLWSRYKNGCYPRFTCIHFNTPARSVMRHRLADMQLWPLPLSDEDICDQRHFMEPPDMYQPGEKYTMRSWEVVRRSGHIHKLACILPHYIPRVISFRDNRGRSGCLVHGTYYMPRDISLTFFPPPKRKVSQSGQGHHHHHHGRGHDVDSQSRDVKHRKLNVDHKKVHLEIDHVYDPSREKEVNLNPGLHDTHPEEMSGSFDDSFRKGQRLPDESFVSSKHRTVKYKNPDYGRGDWSKTRSKNEHAMADSGEKADGHNWDQLFMDTKHNWTNYDNDMKLFNTFTKEMHRNVHSKSRSYNNHNSHAETRKRKQFVSQEDSRSSKRSRRRYKRNSGGHVQSRTQVLYQCLAVMTYVDSYKSLLTVTSGNAKEILCWLVVNSTTVVIVRTSSCNSPTAREILASGNDSALHRDHLHNILYLNQGQHDCDAAFPADRVRPQPIEFREEDSGAVSLLYGVSPGVEGCVLWCVLVAVNWWIVQS